MVLALNIGIRCFNGASGFWGVFGYITVRSVFVYSSMKAAYTLDVDLGEGLCLCAQLI